MLYLITHVFTYVFVTLIILQSHFIEKGFKKTENSEQYLVLLLSLFPLEKGQYYNNNKKDANFRGKPPFKATKQHSNDSQTVKLLQSVQSTKKAMQLALYRHRNTLYGWPGLLSDLKYPICSRTTWVHTRQQQELCESRGGRPGLPSLINLRFLWT